MCYNRPTETKCLLDSLLLRGWAGTTYIFVDAPRTGFDEGNSQVKALVREYAKSRNNIKITLRKENFGCKRNIFEAISEVADEQEFFMVLEDDTIPGQNFFPFMNFYKEIYRLEDEIWTIGGNNFIDPTLHGQVGHYLSKYTHGWGWATWSNRWKKHKKRLENNPHVNALKNNHEFSLMESYYWKRIFKKNAKGYYNTWDYDWLETIWYHSGMNVAPTENLVHNHGFGQDATHTKTDINFQKLVSHGQLEIQTKINSLDVDRDKQEFKSCFMPTMRFLKYISLIS
jgi:hypothetical protein